MKNVGRGLVDSDRSPKLHDDPNDGVAVGVLELATVGAFIARTEGSSGAEKFGY